MRVLAGSIGFAVVGLGAAVTAVSVAGYLAWTSLRGQPEQAPIALSQPVVVTPVESAAQASTAQASTAQTNPAASLPPVQAPASQPSAPSAQPVANWTAQENNYLFDLSHALQPVEYQRLSAAEQLEIARQIQHWLQSGADFWSIRQRFDASYGHSLIGNYAHNREVYIRFATERFAPEYLMTLVEPPPEFRLPYGMEPSYSDPYAAQGQLPPGYWPPEMQPAPYPGSGFDYGAGPWPESMPAPDSQPYPQPNAQPETRPEARPYQRPDAPQIPNVIETST